MDAGEMIAVPQSAIEAYEIGLASPPFDVLKELLATCGYGLECRVVPDPYYHLLLTDHLRALTPAERFQWGTHLAHTVLAAARLTRR